MHCTGQYYSFYWPVLYNGVNNIQIDFQKKFRQSLLAVVVAKNRLIETPFIPTYETEKVQWHWRIVKIFV